MQTENAPTSQVPGDPTATGISVIVCPERPVLDIVFIHGFNSSPERAWTHQGEVCSDEDGNDHDDDKPPSKYRKLLSSESSRRRKYRTRKSVYWPREFVRITAPDARVLTYGYDTRIGHKITSSVSKNTLYDIAWDFLVSLEATRRSQPSRPLLFIAHSLGGIVVKEALRRSHDCNNFHSHLRTIYEYTSGVLFFGTPHGGADPRGPLQHIAERVMRAMGMEANNHIVSTLLPTSERLRELRDTFGPMALQQNWIIYCFQEQYGLVALQGNKVVEDVSSCLNDCSLEIAQHIASDHMGMCRFSRPDDIEYRKVAAAITRVCETIAKTTQPKARKIFNADQRRSNLNSLKFGQFDTNYDTIKEAHAETCRWLLCTPEYKIWLDFERNSEHHGIFYIKGDPGTGKSTMMKFAYENAMKVMTGTAVIFFFFNARGYDLEKSVLGMYRSLLFQLLEIFPKLHVVFDSLLSGLKKQDDSWLWDIETAKRLFSLAVQNLDQRPLICFIDALDECNDEEVRDMVEFFEHLGELAVSFQIRFNVCFSSRHYPYITIERSVQLVLEDQGGHQQDIINYLDSKLKAGQSDRVKKIKAEVLERASGIFLWVFLVVPILNKAYCDGHILSLRKRLKEIPKGLNELFLDILTRDTQNIGELVLCLRWIMFAKRPLRCEELYFAIYAGVDHDLLSTWDPDEITIDDIKRFVLSSSKGLAGVKTSKARALRSGTREATAKQSLIQDHTVHTVQFIHESVREFLLNWDGLNKLQSDLSTNFLGQSHEELKKCCQTYIKFKSSQNLPLSTPLLADSVEEASNFCRFPFLKYAVHNILYHADNAHRYGVSQEDFIEKFNLSDWVDLHNLLERYPKCRYEPNASLLYIFAEKNVPNLIQIIVKQVPTIDIEGQRYRFPLFAAVANKNENALRALLSLDILPTSNDRHQQLMRCILNNKDDIISRKDDQTLLSWAAARGHACLVKVLFATKKVDIGYRTKKERTILSLAAEGGHASVVQMLLETDRERVDSVDRESRTPLSWAAQGGHAAVVQLLITIGEVKVDWKDKGDQTPLSRAAQGGHTATMDLLLETRKVNVNNKDKAGRTPLFGAAQGGHAAAVELLLETGQVDINLKDNNGQTPLLRAAQEGHVTVVKLLEKR